MLISGNRLLALPAMAAALALPLPVLAQYVVTTFKVPGWANTMARDIDRHGNVVGLAYEAGFNTSTSFAILGGQLQLLPGPAGAMGSAAHSISDTGVVVGSWTDSSESWQAQGYSNEIDPSCQCQLEITYTQYAERGFIYQGGQYNTFTYPGARLTQASAISPDGRWVAGLWSTTAYDTSNFLLDRQSGVYSNLGTFGQYDLGFVRDVNSHGQLVGRYTEINYGYSVANPGAGWVSLSLPDGFRSTAIDDSGRLAGWIRGTGSGSGRTNGLWIGALDNATVVHTEAHISSAGSNSLGQIVGARYDEASDTEVGFIASPVALPAAGADNGVFAFDLAVQQGVPVFLDPPVAIGYRYATGAGDPNFASVSLPLGIGDGKFDVVVGGQSFAVLAGQVLDFTQLGFAQGVAAFTVLGIEPEAGLDPNDAQAFVTRVTFVADGRFTGTQIAIVVPEPSTWALALAGLAGLWLRRSRSAAQVSR